MNDICQRVKDNELIRTVRRWTNKRWFATIHMCSLSACCYRTI